MDYKENLLAKYHEDDTLSNRIITVPNCLSFFRLICVPVVAYLVLKDYAIAAIVLFGVTAFTDFLDGFIARKFNQVTKLGKLLDPFADRLLIFVFCTLLVVKEVVPLWVVLAIFVRELMLFIPYTYLIAHGKNVVPVTFLGKVATSLLLIGLPSEALIAALNGEYSNSILRAIEWIGTYAIYAGVALYWAVGIFYLTKAISKITGKNEKEK